MRLIPQKERVEKRQELQEKKPTRKKKSAKKNLKRNPTNTETDPNVTRAGERCKVGKTSLRIMVFVLCVRVLVLDCWTG